MHFILVLIRFTTTNILSVEIFRFSWKTKEISSTARACNIDMTLCDVNVTRLTLLFWWSFKYIEQNLYMKAVYIQVSITWKLYIYSFHGYYLDTPCGLLDPGECTKRFRF